MTATSHLRPIHPGEILREEFLLPLGLSANALDIEKVAKAIEADAGEPLQEIRQALAEVKAGEGPGQGWVTPAKLVAT
jgi:hypothetical protein